MQSGDESDGAAALSDFLSGWETDVGDLPDDQSSLEAEINVPQAFNNPFPFFLLNLVPASPSPRNPPAAARRLHS